MELSGRKILVVEDDEDIREVLRDFFETEGCLVSTAMNGKDALKRLDDGGKPDLIFLDLMMPVMNGQEFVAALGQLPHFAGIPIVIMSADHQTPRTANALNIKWFVRKPITLKSLIDIAEEALGA